ncbi:monocarboxylate transporter 2-like [Watersipora subatra]|uniref:monocarboxylate transporter 2-like n=1 Tax=Watersipora subatra TaxID=2589382 RepID=UPI00355AD5E1
MESSSKSEVSSSSLSATEKSTKITHGEWEDYTPSPPDGGWSWIILFSCFFNNFLMGSFVHTYGIFILDYQRHYQVNIASVSLVSSLVTGMLLMAGPLVAVMVNKWSSRTVGMTGTVMLTAVIIGSTFSPTIQVFQLTYGFLGGTAVGLMYLPATVGVSAYFEKKRTFANGVAQSGVGLGAFAMTPFLKHLLTSTGWKATHFALAGLILQGCICFALQRPLIARRRKGTCQMKKEQDSTEGCSDSAQSINEKLSDPPSNNKSQIGQGCSLGNIPLSKEKITPEVTEPTVSKKTNRLSESLKKAASEIFHLDVLKSKALLVLSIGNFLGHLAYAIPLQFFAARAIGKGISEQNAALLVSFLGITGSVGRLLPGIIMLFYPKVSPLMWTNVCLLAAGLGLMFTPFCYTLASMAVILVILSIGAAGFVCLTTMIVCDLLGVGKLNSGFGVICMLRGIAMIIGPPVGGGWGHIETSLNTLAPEGGQG